MNRLNLILIVSLVIFFSCNDAKEVVPAQLKPNKQMQQLLQSFAKKNPCEDCLYELYINKELPDKFIITIYRGRFSLTQDENIHFNQLPMATITISGKEFKVYSGAEHYFNNNKIVDERKKVIVDSLPNKKYLQPITWTVIDSAGVITKRYDDTYPFFPLPVNAYAAPKSIIKE